MSTAPTPARRYCRYAIAPWVKSDRGWRGDLPEDVGYWMLAEPDHGHRFALFKFKTSETKDVPAATPVSDALDVLLCCAESYSPALALMRDAVKHREIEPPTQERFLWRVEQLLLRYLSEQPKAPYVLARCREDEFGYRRAGGWYWLVAFASSTSRVYWVSSDYFVYCDSADGFDVSREALARLPGAPVLYWPDDDEEPRA